MYEKTINNKQLSAKYDLIYVIFPNTLNIFKKGINIANSATMIKKANIDSNTATAGTK